MANVIIAAITTLGTFLAMGLGKHFGNYFPHFIVQYFGAFVLFGLGGYFVIQSATKFMKQRKMIELSLKDLDEMMDFAVESDIDRSGDISMYEAMFIAIGLTANNLATGVAASLANISILLTCIFTFFISILTLQLGVTAGKSFIGKVFGKYAPLIAGLLIMILGVIQIVT